MSPSSNACVVRRFLGCSRVQKVLLGYEFPDTLMLLAGNRLYIHASAKKRE